MKKMKKVLSLALVLIMLLSAMPMQSFALSLRPLKITGVEFANDNPISMKYVNANSGWGEKVSLEEDYFDTVDTFYDFYVYFSDGDKVLFSEIFEIFDKKDEINGYSYAITVDYDECYNAILNDEETVNVYIDLDLHTNKKTLTYECTLEKKIVPYIVKNMKPVSELPTQVYSDMDGTEAFGGAQFEVEYYGGTKEIVTCGYDAGMVLAPDFYGSSSFAYLDGYYYHEFEEIDPLYTDVKIDDCEFSDNKLKEVTFTLTKNDGTTEQYTRILDIGVDDYAYEVEKINGYDVDICFYNQWSTFVSYGDFEVSIYIGENSDEVFFKAEDVCSCKICHYKGLRYIYYCIMSAIWKLFNVNEYCVCGAVHWYK